MIIRIHFKRRPFQYPSPSLLLFHSNVLDKYFINSHVGGAVYVGPIWSPNHIRNMRLISRFTVANTASFFNTKHSSTNCLKICSFRSYCASIITFFSLQVAIAVLDLERWNRRVSILSNRDSMLSNIPSYSFKSSLPSFLWLSCVLRRSATEWIDCSLFSIDWTRFFHFVISHKMNVVIIPHNIYTCAFSIKCVNIVSCRLHICISTCLIFRRFNFVVSTNKIEYLFI